MLPKHILQKVFNNICFNQKKKTILQTVGNFGRVCLTIYPDSRIQVDIVRKSTSKF